LNLSEALSQRSEAHAPRTQVILLKKLEIKYATDFFAQEYSAELDSSLP
jgi:hypothetical protein